MRYRAEIDGLRALAVIPVILYHASLDIFAGGFVGVDVFFVISGYLITSIILSEMDEEKFSLLNFYERRARRILPALFFVTAVCIPFAWLWFIPNNMKDFAQSIIAISTFSSNILFWHESGYFDAAAELKPLLHTWSLAVEEQYYIFFPLFLMFTWRLGKRWLLSALIVCALISLGAAHLSAYSHPSANFYLLPTRSWELLIGSFIAFYFNYFKPKQVSSKINKILSSLGIGLIVCSIIWFDKQTPFPSLYALAPTVGAALVILYTQPGTIAYRILSNRLAVGIGLISYSAYLWHYPLFAFAKYKFSPEPSSVLVAFLCLLTILLAYVSWRFVETPFRNRSFLRKRSVFVGFSSIACVFAGFGVSGHTSNGYEYRYNATQLKIVGAPRYSTGIIYRTNSCFLNADQDYSEFDASCFASEEGGALVWGDSFAAAMSVGMIKVFPPVTQLTASACPPVIGMDLPVRPHCRSINDHILGIIETRNFDTIYLHAAWNWYADNYVNALRSTILHIQNIAPQSKIVVVGNIPQWFPTLPAVIADNSLSLIQSFMYVNSERMEQIRQSDSLLEAILSEFSIKYIKPIEELCRGNECLATIPYEDGVELITWDMGHLSEGGSIYMAETIWQKLY